MNTIEIPLDGRLGDLQHECASDKSAAFLWHNHISLNKRTFSKLYGIQATKLRLREQIVILPSIIKVSLKKRPVYLLAMFKSKNKSIIIKCVCMCIGWSSYLCMASLSWIFLWFSCDGRRTAFLLTSHWGRVWTATLNWEREKIRLKTAVCSLVAVLYCLYGK